MLQPDCIIIHIPATRTDIKKNEDIIVQFSFCISPPFFFLSIFWSFQSLPVEHVLTVRWKPGVSFPAVSHTASQKFKIIIFSICSEFKWKKLLLLSVNLAPCLLFWTICWWWSCKSQTRKFCTLKTVRCKLLHTRKRQVIFSNSKSSVQVMIVTFWANHEIFIARNIIKN